MRIEVRATGTPVCDQCGAAPLIFVASTNRTLETELAEQFDHDVPWWRPFRRATHRRVRAEIDRVGEELRAATVSGS